MLKMPLITEKTMLLARNSQYTFVVFKEATKEQIAKIVEEKFKVNVLSVKTINLPSKRKRQRTNKGFYGAGGLKKAVIMLKSGQKIPLFEQAAIGDDEQDVTVTTAEGEKVATVKEKKSLLKGTKVKIERGEKIEAANEAEDTSRDAKKETRQQAGKTKGDK